jgi:hypothetical protein
MVKNSWSPMIMKQVTSSPTSHALNSVAIIRPISITELMILFVNMYIPESAFPAFEDFYRFYQILFLKIRPAFLWKIQLGVRKLPKEKIAYAHLSAGADQKIRIRHSIGIKIPAKCFLV